MARFQESIEINAPIQECFEQWMRFEEFPQFMDHVKSINKQADNHWHWIVDGPLGSKLEWDAVMDGKLEDKMISWHSISDSTVDVQGAILFDEVGMGTRVTSTLQYEPPVGALGEVVARVFSNPQAMVKQDLENFKRLLESNNFYANRAL